MAELLVNINFTVPGIGTGLNFVQTKMAADTMNLAAKIFEVSSKNKLSLCARVCEEGHG